MWDEKEKSSHCQLEIDIPNYEDIESLAGTDENSLLPPLWIMSFDIECAAEKGRFPDAKLDWIIQIANIC